MSSKVVALLDEVVAVMRGEHGADWADHFGPLFNMIEDVRAGETNGDLCPRCRQSMPGGQALHTEHCPADETSGRKFSGPGHLEETGYIPAGSAAEREAKSAETSAPPRATELAQFLEADYFNEDPRFAAAAALLRRLPAETSGELQRVYGLVDHWYEQTKEAATLLTHAVSSPLSSLPDWGARTRAFLARNALKATGESSGKIMKEPQ